MNNITFRSPLAALLLAVTVVACDNPVSHEDHAEPDGLVIRAGTAELIRVDDEGVTGLLAVSAGGTTPELTVTFVDHDGDEITFDLDEYRVEVTSTSSATATWQGTGAGGFTGRVAGHEAGATTLSFQLVHGPPGAGHEDGDPYVVPVTVTVMQP